MQTTAAVLRNLGGPFDVEEIEVAPPGPREVLVEMVASGVCGSDVHLRDGLLPLPRPMVCGHEGAGIVREVGSEVRRVKPGDHALLAWVPSCGLCRFCAGGSSHLCETVGMALEGKMWDGTTRFSDAFGEPLFHHMMVSSFSRHAVLSEASVVAVPDELPLAPLALVGCAVATGVGAVVRTAGVKLGDHVAVIGCGGVGLNAVQGARLGGASASSPSTSPQKSSRALVASARPTSSMQVRRMLSRRSCRPPTAMGSTSASRRLGAPIPSSRPSSL